MADWEIVKGNTGGDYEFSYHLNDIDISEGRVKLWVRQKTVNEATKSQIELVVNGIQLPFDSVLFQ